MKLAKTMLLLALGALLCTAVAGCGAAELNPNTQKNLQSALEAKKGEFQKCYENALTGNREIQGEMALKLDIDQKTGKVTNAKVAQTQIQDDGMKKCVSMAAEDITLSEPPNVPVEGQYDVSFAYAP